eukprot:COSAG02_NODE_11048_length_1805_cov_2.400938_1_plen_82_part_00
MGGSSVFDSKLGATGNWLIANWESTVSGELGTWEPLPPTASLVSGRVSVTAAESLSVSTKDFGFVASGSIGIDSSRNGTPF